MSTHKLANLIVAVVGFASFGCSGQSPITPTASPDGARTIGAQPIQPAPGVYELSFHVLDNGTLDEVSSLPVSSDELILKAHVEDSSHVPAQGGAATFEYCSFKGLPPNDITRADEAPKEACENGTATWARLAAVSVDAESCPGFGSGNACMSFGIVQIPRTVGFRFRFIGQGSGIANGVSAAENFTWTP